MGGPFNSSAFDTAIANSVAAGVAYAVAAGNSAEDAATHSPANHPDVLTVSALADFSNFGSLIEITVPWVCTLSTRLNGGYDTISGTWSGAAGGTISGLTHDATANPDPETDSNGASITVAK